MRLEHLQAFLDVVETKSFTLAAHKNGVTESAVSQQVAVFEKDLKVFLIDRSRKPFRLTPAGEIFYDCTRNIIRLYVACNDALAQLKQTASQTLRIATTAYIGLHYLPCCLARFQKDYPHINVFVEYGHTDEVIERFLNDEADLAVVVEAVRNPKIERILLRIEPLVLICHPEHRLAQKGTVRLAEFNGQTFMCFADGFPDHERLQRILNSHKVKGWRSIEFGDIEPIKRAVEIGAGVALVPRTTVEHEVADSSLVALSIAGKELHHPLLALHKRWRPLTPAAKQFVTALKGTI